MELIESEEPSRLHFGVDAKLAHWDHRIELAPKGDGTEILHDYEITLRGLGMLASPLIGLMMRRTLRKAMTAFERPGVRADYPSSIGSPTLITPLRSVLDRYPEEPPGVQCRGGLHLLHRYPLDLGHLNEGRGPQALCRRYLFFPLSRFATPVHVVKVEPVQP